MFFKETYTLNFPSLNQFSYFSYHYFNDLPKKLKKTYAAEIALENREIWAGI